jgi:hypothetical protein
MTGDMSTIDIRPILKSQYHASLAMLREAIELCPDDVWYDTSPMNACWQVALSHAVLCGVVPGSESGVLAWLVRASGKCPAPGRDPGPRGPRQPLALVAKPYTQAQTLEYWRVVDAMVDGAIDAMDLTNPQSGFHYRIPKLEHQLANIRHVQHGVAQLADRLRAARDVGVRWVEFAADFDRGRLRQQKGRNTHRKVGQQPIA